MAAGIPVEHAIRGIHHITLVASNAERTARFYVNVLGMGFVKKTVNFDQPETYHLYFGDRTGTPGTLVTFFEWPRVQPARIGIGSTHHFALTVESLDALLKWKTWLQHAHRLVAGPYDHGAYQSLIFTDPDGVILELATVAGSWDGLRSGDDVMPSGHHQLANRTWPHPVTEISPDMAIHSIHHIAPISSDLQRTAAFYEDTLGMTRLLETVDADNPGAHRWYWTAGEGDRHGAPATIITYSTLGESESHVHSRIGHGSTHHFAFEVADDQALYAWRERLLAAGLQVTPVLDRKYFHSIYSNDPDGHILEWATSGPGFTVDQPVDRLGMDLMLPPWLEADRDRIEAAIPPIHLD